jgi:acyl-CoA thioester hydrolase
MTAVYKMELQVTPDLVDTNRHVNNVAYVQWMQDVATGHANACGGAALAKQLGAAWFVRTHRIEYLKPAVLGDQIRLITWVADWRRVRSLRRYRFTRNSDQALLAEGETDWVFVDASSGRPKTIPAEVVDLFGLLPNGPVDSTTIL